VPILPANRPGDDLELLEALGRGEPQAVALLYQRHGARMLAFARRYIGDEASAEDVVIDLLRRWLERPPNVREFERLGAFLATSVYHAAIDWIRRDRSERGHPPRGEVQAALRDGRTAQPVDASGPSAPHDAMRIRLAAGLAQLSRSDRLLLETHYGQALTADECVALLGISRAAFHQRLHRARTRLAQQLAAVGVAAQPEEQE
jgi:RNA polymerase sigma-70 factor (ECF subfamily)